MTVIEEWNRLKRDKNKTSKVTEKARKDFMKKGKTVFWIGRKNMREILKKRTMDKEYLKADLEFLRDQRTKRKMSLGSKDRAYCKRIEKRDVRKKRSLELPGRSNNKKDILSEIEFSSDTSNMNTSLDSESFVTSLIGQSTRTNTSTQSALQEQVKLPKTFVQDIALTGVSHNISSRNLMRDCPQNTNLQQRELYEVVRTDADVLEPYTQHENQSSWKCVTRTVHVMSKAIYYLKIQLLHPQLTYKLTVSQLTEVNRMTEFVSVFYSVWFLHLPLICCPPAGY